MAEVKKQEMPFVIAELLREQAITEKELLGFSAELRERVEYIRSIEACQKDSPSQPLLQSDAHTAMCVGTLTLFVWMLLT